MRNLLLAFVLVCLDASNSSPQPLSADPNAIAPQAQEQSPAEQARPLYESASQYLEEGQYRLALLNANKALLIDPSNWAALYVRSRCRIHDQEYGEALKDIEAALRLAPQDGSAQMDRMFFTYAYALNEIGQYRSALDYSDRAIAANARNSNAYAARAWALSGLGNRAEALDALKQAALLSGRQQALYERAQELPEARDILALFRGGPPEARHAEAKAEDASGPGTKTWIYATVFLTLGIFLLFGLFRDLAAYFSSRAKKALPRRSRSARAAGPAQAGSRSDGELIAGSYQVLRKIGVGGMGVVYEALDRTLERKVAVKKMREEIRADARERARFIHEARTVAALHHPHIVEIYSIVEHGPDVYLVFEHVDGRTLHHLIQTEGAMPFARAIALMRGVCAALAYAHKHGVIHRDLKPSNIMINSEGKVKVMDFGVARLAKDSASKLSITSTIVGTPPYMAPEQEQGMVRRESDLFALAVCLYEMATAQLPFSGMGAGMLISKLNKTYVPASRLVSGLPAGFDDALARALEPDPDNRPHDAADFLRAFESLMARR